MLPLEPCCLLTMRDRHAERWTRRRTQPAKHLNDCRAPVATSSLGSKRPPSSAPTYPKQKLYLSNNQEAPLAKGSLYRHACFSRAVVCCHWRLRRNRQTRQNRQNRQTHPPFKAERFKKIRLNSGIEIVKRDSDSQASHPARPFFWGGGGGNSEGRDWNFQARLKFSSEIEHSIEIGFCSRFGPLGPVVHPPPFAAFWFSTASSTAIAAWGH